MIKSLFLLSLAFLFSFPAEAQENTAFPSETDFLRAVQKQLRSVGFDEMASDLFSMLDVNNDKYVSENEIKQFANGMPAEDEKKKEHVFTLFHQTDTDKDNRLNAAEMEKFFSLWQEELIKEKFQSLKQTAENFDSEQRLSLEEREKKAEERLKENENKMDEALAKLQQAVKDLESIDPKEAAQNMLKNMATAQADENFYQMNKKKDNCVTRENFAAYNIEQQQNMDPDGDFKLSYQDFLEMYDEIKKKNPNCLTKEEYMADYVEQMSFDLSEI